MADRLTQLQDCLDQLATQMFACLRYINSHHDFAAIPGQPDMNPQYENQTESGPGNNATTAQGAGAGGSGLQENSNTQAQNSGVTGGMAATTAEGNGNAASIVAATATAATEQNTAPTDQPPDQQAPSQPQTQLQQPANTPPTATSPSAPLPDPPAIFSAALQELARDLIIKEQQIEALADALPGAGISEATQLARVAELETRLREAARERSKAVAERDRLLARLDAVVGRVGRGWGQLGAEGVRGERRLGV